MLFQISTPKSQVIIREATPEDASSLLELRLESLRMHPKAFAADADQTAAGGVKAIIDLISGYGQAHNGTLVIALAGDELIGMTGIALGHWPKMRHGGGLWGVYVRPAWRGLRIAEAMIHACFEWAMQNKVSVVYLGVTVSEIPAIHCYTRCGFKEYGVEPKSLYFEGRYYDQMMMYKLLDIS